MTSPLAGRSIIRAKLTGSLFAIRWLIASALLAWTLAAMVEAIWIRDALRWGGDMIVIGAFMAAVGVRASLSCETATRAMAITIGIWLGAYVVVAVAAFLAIGVVLLFGNAVQLLLEELGLIPMQPTIWGPVPMYIAWPIMRCVVYLLATIGIEIDTRLRFDRLAGRMVEGKVGVAIDQMLHGRPHAIEFVEKVGTGEIGV